jgi:hypothetical protein
VSFSHVSIPEISVVCPHCKEQIRLPEDDMRRTASAIEYIVTMNALRRLRPLDSSRKMIIVAFLGNVAFQVWLMAYWGFGLSNGPPTRFDVIMGAFSVAVVSASYAHRVWAQG